ncbi:MAG: TIGR03013 family PEP-CTERM/XrtA system glycosyltransferase [Nitrospirota bacterium]|nr:TIGR03013 family PEP-CTERM/XrtA system glycosyltransferase [Nitrospirota bacterium]
MFKHYISINTVLAFSVDFFLLFWSAYMGFYLRFYGFGGDTGSADFGWLNALAFVAVGQFSIFLLDLYQFEARLRLSQLFRRMVIAFLVFAISLTSIYYFVPSLAMGRGVFVIALGLSVLLLFFWRISLTMSQKSLRVQSRVAVLGAGSSAAMVADLIQMDNTLGCELVGFISEGEEFEPIAVKQEKILGGKKDLLNIVQRQKVDKIIVALSDRRGAFPLRAILDCKMRGVEIYDMPSFYEKMTGKILIRDLRPSWLIFCDGFRRTELTQLVKRASDILLSLLLLVFSAPIMMITTLLIKTESRGPALFRQERVGEHGKVFTLVKFRSMSVDAEKESGPVWAGQGDARVTRVGRFIRKTRIDELPQLFNILKGEMSFIGPRPERPHFVSQLQEKIPYYSQRHTVKPGLTGWAQVRYQYGATVEDALEKLQYDLYYIKNMSIFLDALVIFDTVKVVLFGKGAR